MSDKVKIEVMSSDTKQLVAFFPSTGIPFESNFTFKKYENSQKLNACELTSNMNFIGDDSVNKNCKYYLGIRENNVLKMESIVMYRMDPIIDLNNDSLNENTIQSSLTVREQFDEMKEKFGSRKSQRSLASKRKYAIEFDEEDLKDVETNDNNTNKTIDETPSVSNTVSITVDILPKQNREAICVENVYQLNDIIKQNEQIIIKQLEEELFGDITNTYVLNLVSDSNDSNKKMIAIYIDLIIQIIQLKATELKKADPLPLIHNEVKVFLFERYSITQHLPNNKLKYVISDKEKDRLLIYGIILSLMLYNYRPIDMELLQKSFKVPLRQLRRIIEIIGCYVENTKHSSGVNNKSVVIKIPLNSLKESKRRR